MKTSGSSGLGLSVARPLAELLGGGVTVVASLPAIYVHPANPRVRTTGSPL